MPGLGLAIEGDDGDTQIEPIPTMVSSACTCLTHGEFVPQNVAFARSLLLQLNPLLKRFPLFFSFNI